MKRSAMGLLQESLDQWMNLSWATALMTFLWALVMGIALILTARWHGRWTHDAPTGIQKFHEAATPRIGGVAIVLGVILGFYVEVQDRSAEAFAPVLLAGIVPFLVGLKEDVFKSASVAMRFGATAVAAGVLAWSMDWYITRVDIPGVDTYLGVSVAAWLLTVIAVTGMTNAINILDGFNGLASGVAVNALIFIAALALDVGDADLAESALILVLAVLAFILLNFPFGKIFMGDGGAYFLGFCLAWLAILLSERNPLVSPWASLVICAYPVVEVLYSMQRRMRARVSSTQPDNNHLHTLIKRRLVKRYFADYPMWLRNSMVAPSIWVVNIMMGFAGFWLSDRPLMLMWVFGVFVVLYVMVYELLSRLPEPEESMRTIESE